LVLMLKILILLIFLKVTFYIKFRLRNKNDNFEWVLIVVYGAGQNEFKEGFLRELVHTV
jgi:hypothetical protein